MNSLELFSGVGGFAKGLELAGLKHSALIELNKNAYASLCENFQLSSIFLGDIRNFDFNILNDIDVVAGGPPCQPFSLGGKHKGEQDERDMFPYAINAIETLRPKAFVFENVKGLLRGTFADYFEYIILRLTYPSYVSKSVLDWQDDLNRFRNISRLSYTENEYNVQFKLINSANYGVPQIRDRVVIVGIRSDLECSWSFPIEPYSEDRLFWDIYVTGSYWNRHNVAHSERLPIDSLTERKIAKIVKKYGTFGPASMPWRTLRDTLSHLPNPISKHGIVDHIFHGGARIYTGHTGSPLDAPSKTIKAGDHGVPGGENMIRFPDGTVRYLTVFEAKLLQTFPDDFIVKGRWGEAMRQIGNAVPVLLAETIGHELVKALNSTAPDRAKIKAELSSTSQFSYTLQ